MDTFIEKMVMAIIPDFLIWLRNTHPGKVLYLMSDVDIAYLCQEYLAYMEEREEERLDRA